MKSIMSQTLKISSKIKTKYQIISDIHLEFDPEFNPSMMIIKDDLMLNPTKPNLILAGDIGYPSHPTYRQFLRDCQKMYENIYLITGNHEYYDSYKTGQSINEINNQIQTIQLIFFRMREF